MFLKSVKTLHILHFKSHISFVRILCWRHYKCENSARIKDGSIRVNNDEGHTDRQSGSLSFGDTGPRHQNESVSRVMN